MSIVKMKRLRLFGMASDREELLKRLQHLGCVEIDEPADKLADPDWAALTRVDDTALAELKARSAALNAALITLKKYAPTKGGFLAPRPEITEAQLFDENTRAKAIEAADAVGGQEKHIAQIFSEESKLKSQKLSLSPWLQVDVPLDLPSSKEVSITFGAIAGTAPYGEMEAALAAVTDLVELTPGGRDREMQYVLVLCHRSVEEEVFEVLKKYGFTRSALRGWSGTAQHNTDALNSRLRALEAELEGAKKAIAAEGIHQGVIQLVIDRLTQDIQRAETKGRLLASQATIFFEGWVPGVQVDALRGVLSDFVCCWETEDPAPEDYPVVPVKLKSNALTRPMNMVTEMYSLPAYDGVDPNPLIMPFFVFFFGFMFADLGYGILLVLVALFVQKRLKPKGTMGYMFGLMFEVGISSAVIGLFTGGFFGDAIKTVSNIFKVSQPAIPFLSATAENGAMPPLLDVMNDPLTVLIFCLGVGMVQIIAGMGIKAYMLIRDGHVLDAVFDVGSWWILFAGVAVGALAGNWIVALVGVAMLVLTQGRDKKGILSKLVGGVASLYDITAYFGDILSYSRLMVMMLAGSVIGSIFNLLGSMPGNIFVFAVVFVVGHAFNMGLNIIGTYVHASRLQYLEYFGKFYKEGGRPFRPLNINTKFVDIAKEEH